MNTLQHQLNQEIQQLLQRMHAAAGRAKTKPQAYLIGYENTIKSQGKVIDAEKELKKDIVDAKELVEKQGVEEIIIVYPYCVDPYSFDLDGIKSLAVQTFGRNPIMVLGPELSGPVADRLSFDKKVCDDLYRMCENAPEKYHQQILSHYN